VDIIIVSLPFSISDAATGDVVINGQSVVPPASPWRWLLYALYFFVLEARWGASLGKQLFGLRLSSPGGAGWVKRVARRTIGFHLPWLVVSLLLVSFGPIGPTRDIRLGENGSLNARQTRGLIESVLTLTLIAGLFVTARTFQRLGRVFTSSPAAHASSRERRRSSDLDARPVQH
jgi:uncharacterized RDD family membrane protein YckC